MRKNIIIAYFLVLCKHSWFWLGVWVFYYLRFTNYAGIGIIETVLILTMTTTEIPTGAIADLLGKRKTLILAFLFEAGGAWWYALTGNFWGLMGSVFIMCLGGSLYSGTLDALVYDTLKDHHRESWYEKILANIQTIYLLSVAIFGLLGGYLYTVYFRLPFILNALVYSFGLIAAFFLTEPLSDSATFSLSNFITQIKKGLSQLFQTTAVARYTILLLIIGFVVVILDEMLHSFLGIEFGLKAESMSLVWAAIFLLSAVTAQFTPTIKRIFGITQTVFGAGLVVGLTLIMAPFLNPVWGTLSILVSNFGFVIFNNLASVMINQQTASKYRATTISTFNMIKNIPYILTAYLFGILSDTISARNSGAILGSLLLFALSLWFFIPKIGRKSSL